MAKKTRPVKKADKNKKEQNRNNELFGVIIIGLSIFSFLSVYTSSAGIIGIGFNYLLKGLFGIAAYIMPFLLFIAGIFAIISYYKRINKLKLFLTILSMIIILGIVHLIYYDKINSSSMGTFIKDSYDKGIKNIGAGAVISFMVFILHKGFGLLGSYVFLTMFLIIDVLLLTNLSIKQMGKKIYTKMNVGKAYFKSSTKNDDKEKKQEQRSFIGETIEIQNDIDKPDPDYLENAFLKDGNSSSGKVTSEIVSEHGPAEELDHIKIVDYKKDNKVKYTENDKNEKSANTAKTCNEGTDSIEIANNKRKILYSFPPLSLLKEPIHSKEAKISDIKIKNNAKLLEETLNNFGITARVVRISRGPAITRYELQPAPGVKVSRIVSLSDDIALSLAATGVRIEAPIPGKAAVGVEVPNKDILPVLLREVLQSDEFVNHPSKLAFALGKDIAGQVVVADIGTMPHLLIAGATGSGKSVCINTLITSILYKASPEDVKLILVDPKIVELSHFNGIPHLLIPVVTDPKKAAGALNWAVQEMLSRYKLFADKGVKDIERYNEVVDGTEETKLPKIIVIIDELADLMMVAPGEVEDAICRLAQMARAAGIHLVIATQRPSVDVITGLIKANIPSRIAFAVSSNTDSRTILDMGGAEKLLGRGDMLFYPSGASKPMRVQGCFVSEAEVEKVVEYIKEQYEQEELNYDIDIMEEIAADKFNATNGECDELLPEAIEIVIDAGQASISMLQRRLRIGYARAARLIDEMEVRGIVSGFDGSKPRNVLISKEEFEREYKNENL